MFCDVSIDLAWGIRRFIFIVDFSRLTALSFLPSQICPLLLLQLFLYNLKTAMVFWASRQIVLQALEETWERAP
jgi:hypothetical protein